MAKQLVPELNLRARFLILGVMLLPVVLAYRVGVVVQLLACILPLVLTGTYRVSRVFGETFDTQFFLAYVPFPRSRCKLPGVVTIHTKYQVAHGWWTLVLFGPVQWVFGFIFDYLIPALGGPYEIWLETAKGREILAWNGYNQRHFESNLELLRVKTGAEIRIR